MRLFFDTNVLVYSQDKEEPGKRSVARALVEEAIGAESFVVSTQVLLEFYATVLRRRMLGSAQALELVRAWSEHDTVVQTPDLLLRGFGLQQVHSLSVWDALIVQAALDARCGVLLSEDLQHGARFGELSIANPFLEVPRAHEPRARYARPRRSRQAATGKAGG